MNYRITKGYLVRKIKDLPIIWYLYKVYTEYKLGHRLHSKNTNAEKVFSDIYKNNDWNNEESLSGQGSELKHTKRIKDELPNFLSRYEVKSILDAPCGDFNWMRHVQFGNVKYTGGDIVQELIDINNKLYRTPLISFEKINIIEDKLPKVDLIFIRDCLVHFDNKSIFLFFKNLINSEIKYLLTTNFPLTHHNYDITMGNWRPINLKRKPYNLPNEIDILWEESTEDYGQFPDKSLFLWKIDDIRHALHA